MAAMLYIVLKAPTVARAGVEALDERRGDGPDDVIGEIAPERQGGDEEEVDEPVDRPGRVEEADRRGGRGVGHGRVLRIGDGPFRTAPIFRNPAEIIKRLYPGPGLLV